MKQRELKFRAWDKKKKEFISNYDAVYLRDDGAVYELKSTNYQGDYLSILDVVVQMFTGLLDKNGKEIYEGDIMRVYKPNTYLKGKDLHIIKWHEIEAAFGYFNVRVNHFDTNRTGGLMNIGTNKNGSWCEVIGNIHQHPSLLN